MRSYILAFLVILVAAGIFAYIAFNRKPSDLAQKEYVEKAKGKSREP